GRLAGRGAIESGPVDEAGGPEHHAHAPAVEVADQAARIRGVRAELEAVEVGLPGAVDHDGAEREAWRLVACGQFTDGFGRVLPILPGPGLVGPARRERRPGRVRGLDDRSGRWRRCRGAEGAEREQ